MNPNANVLPPRHAVRVIIRSGDRICVCKKFAGGLRRYTVFPGGGVEPGATYEETCIKETLEEVGILITNVKSLNFSAELAVSNKTIESGKAERAGKYSVLINHYFTADFLKADDSVLGNDNDAMVPTWMTVQEAITLMREEGPVPTALERIKALQLL